MPVQDLPSVVDRFADLDVLVLGVAVRGVEFYGAVEL
jgi:hypothetical protein